MRVSNKLNLFNCTSWEKGSLLQNNYIFCKYWALEEVETIRQKRG